MKRPRPTSVQHKNLGGYSFALEPGRPQKLYVGTYSPDNPWPKFRITIDHSDKEAVVHEEMVAGQDDGLVRLYYFFENYGQVTVQVRMERVG
jgi:hypothetical protein